MTTRKLKSLNIVSVIISAYNSEGTLGRTLESLENQSLDKALYEVIVVDDGSKTTGTKEVTEYYITRGNMKLLYFRQENLGVGIARNFGISKSVGKTLAFTDADCICDHDWLLVIYQSLVVEGKQFIGGDTYSNDTLIFPWKMAPAGQAGITANLACDFTLLDDVLFDSGFTGMLGDDTDFVLRMEANNIPLIYIKEMRILHPVNIIGIDRVIIRARGRLNEVGLYKRHGVKVLGSFSPIFRPTIVSRISPFSIVLILGVACLFMIVKLYGYVGFLAFSLLFFGFFQGYLYRFFVIYNPDNRPISLEERIKTFYYFLIITPLFVYYRIQGMIRFKFFML